MKTRHGLGGAALLAASVLLAGGVGAQAPESLLPKGLDRPALPKAPKRPKLEAAPIISAQPLFEAATPKPQAIASAMASSVPVIPHGPISLPYGITSFDQLAALPQDKLDALLGLTARYDIPPAAQRALSRVGVIDSSEGGMPPFSLGQQPAALVRAALAGNNGQMVSRWGHILLRRALASRLDAPQGMGGAEFAALRAGLLLRMGEGDAAREIVQDVDPGNYDAGLTQAAVDAYVATADFTGICPVMQLGTSNRADAQWQVLRGICMTFGGQAAGGLAQIDRLTKSGALPKIDMLLAQKYAGAAGVAGRGGRRAVKIEWEGVSDMTPWRYGLTLAVGLTPPAALMKDAGPAYDYVTALAPMAPLGLRADASDRAGAAGVLSAAAMVDLYAQIYANDDITDGPAERALGLRDAYVGESPQARLKAMQALWDGGANAQARYGRMVLTAYAAARLSASADLSDAAGDIIASMLAAGLDANALRWRAVCEPGSAGWMQIALAAPQGGQVDSGAIDRFRSADKSDGQHRSALLVAGLAGLGRISDSVAKSEAGKLNVSLEGRSGWINAIDAAAATNNQTLVALLAGLGMQGDSWAKMTPRYLFHIVSALNKVGLGAEARMIAAEAAARG